MASCGGNPFLSDENVGLGLERVSSNPFEEGSTRSSQIQPPPRPSRPPSQPSLPPSSPFPTSSPLTPSNPVQVSGLFGAPSNDEQEDEFSERFLTCTICLETYNETPKLLPCMHSFCCGCIQKLAQDKRKFSCPVCRREVLVPRQGVGALPNNIFVRDLTDFLSEQPNRPRVSSTVPALESHSVTQRPRARINEPKIDRHASGNIFQRAALRLKLQFSSKKRRNCQYHSEKELKYYCSTCNIIVCKKCIRYEHEDGHMILNLSSAAEDRLRAINSLMFEAESRVQPLEHGRNNVNTQLQSLKERHTKTKSEIRDAFESIKLFLQQQETTCMTKLNTQYQRKYSLLSSQLNNLDLKLSTIKSACTFTKRTVDDLQNADYEMVAMSFQLSARIEEVLAMQAPDLIKPAADDVLEVQQNVETMNSVRGLIKDMVTVQEN